MIHATNRFLRGTAWVPVLAASVLLSCKTEEDTTREKIVGDYVSEYRGDGFYVKDLLTLRSGGSWIRTREIFTRKGQQPTSPDSGTYRITGVTINLRSLVQGGMIPVRYTILGDTLFGANAAEARRLGGGDIAEEVLVRAR